MYNLIILNVLTDLSTPVTIRLGMSTTTLLYPMTSTRTLLTDAESEVEIKDSSPPPVTNTVYNKRHDTQVKTNQRKCFNGHLTFKKEGEQKWALSARDSERMEHGMGTGRNSRANSICRPPTPDSEFAMMGDEL